jgi:misacylated tRNA(Ala) deacylase
MTDELFREDAYLARCQALVIALDGLDLYLNRTVLYPTGGGQPGDRGRLVLADGGTLPVEDTRKGAQGIAHRLAEGAAAPAAGAELTAEVDWPRRYRLMRMHSAMHLLCAAVACPVTGGQVGEAKSRLDFDLQRRAVDKDEVAEKIARWIADDRAMSVRPPTTGGRVRLVEIEGVDLQACGGTHVRSTREIGALAVGKLENKGRQNRRISLTLTE